MRSCSHLVKPVSQLAKPRVKADSAIRPHLETTTWQQQRQRQQHERQNNRQAWEMLQKIEEVSTRFEIRAEGSHYFISVRKVCCFYYFFLPDTLTEMRAQGFVIYFNKNLEYFKMNLLSVHIGFLSSCYACLFAQMF